MIRALLPLFVVLVAGFALADAALGCAVCSGGDDQKVRDSYIGATIFMSLLPLFVAGAGFLFLRRRFRNHPHE